MSVPVLWRTDQPAVAPRPSHVQRTVDTRQRLGKCYQYAAYYMMDHEVGHLVHGTISIGGRRSLGELGIPIAHAWVQGRTWVYDGACGRFFERRSYYTALRAVPEQRYTAHQARARLLRYHHFGPWGPTQGLQGRPR